MMGDFLKIKTLQFGSLFRLLKVRQRQRTGWALQFGSLLPGKDIDK